MTYKNPFCVPLFLPLITIFVLIDRLCAPRSSVLTTTMYHTLTRHLSTLASPNHAKTGHAATRPVHTRGESPANGPSARGGGWPAAGRVSAGAVGPTEDQEGGQRNNACLFYITFDQNNRRCTLYTVEVWLCTGLMDIDQAQLVLTTR